MSLNTQCICIACAKEERQHQDYKRATDAKLEAIRNSNCDFIGVGWPGKNGWFKQWTPKKNNPAFHAN